SSFVMMGWIGTVPLAAHGIALQCASIAFMVPLGIGQAGTIRVGLAAGERNPASVGRAGWTALALALVFMSCTAVLFWTAPEPLLALFLDRSNPQADEVLAIGAGLLAVAALFQLFDGAQVVGANILRGLSDTRVPMMIAIAGYWGVGFTLAYLLGFTLSFGARGIWFGLAAGLATVAIAAVWRFAWRERIGLIAA